MTPIRPALICALAAAVLVAAWLHLPQLGAWLSTADNAAGAACALFGGACVAGVMIRIGRLG